MRIYAIIPSGGSGSRIGGEIPKQYLQFNGMELIVYTLKIFQNCDLIDEIIVSAKKDYHSLLQTLKEKYSLVKFTKVVEGGKERQDSVFNALKSIKAAKEDLIAVHDAVRPLLSQQILIESIETAKKFGSAVVALKAKDTLIKGNDFVESFVDRNEIYYAQTPQVFRFDILMESIQKAETDKFIGTDESMIVNRYGYKVKIVKGSSSNFKITNQDDIDLFTKICSSC